MKPQQHSHPDSPIVGNRVNQYYIPIDERRRNKWPQYEEKYNIPIRTGYLLKVRGAEDKVYEYHQKWQRMVLVLAYRRTCSLFLADGDLSERW